MSRERISAGRLAALREQLATADQDILATLGAVRLASGGQLRRHHLWHVSERTGRRTLAQLEGLGLVRHLERRLGGIRSGSDGLLYQLSAAGVRLAHPGIRARTPWPISPRFQRHLLAVTELVVSLGEGARAGHFLIHTLTVEQASYRHFSGPYGERITLKPDLYVCLHAAGFFAVSFVEVDLASESPATIRAKAAVYIAYYATGQEQTRHDGVFPRVVFLVPDEARREEVTEALDELRPEHRRLFAVHLLAEATRVLAPNDEAADAGSGA